MNWQWRTDIVPRFQPVKPNTVVFDPSSEEGEILIKWGFEPKVLGYIPNVRGVVTGVSGGNVTAKSESADQGARGSRGAASEALVGMQRVAPRRVVAPSKSAYGREALRSGSSLAYRVSQRRDSSSVRAALRSCVSKPSVNQL